MKTSRRNFVLAPLVLAAATLLGGAAPAAHAGGAAPAAHAGGGSHTLFVRSAIENTDGTVTLPLYRGTSHGAPVWYVLLDSSDGGDADRLGVNRSSKLALARGSTAVQRVQVQGGLVDFPASVDFAPARLVVPGPTGFPPAAAEPGARGQWGYSPLIEMPDGTIRNAPQVANASGTADKVVSIDYAAGRVRLQMTRGFSGGKLVHYVSTDASDPGVAALEGVTYAPALNGAPFAGGDGTNSSRTSLVAFVNGQTGAGNPQRQGLSSALLDGQDPLNLLFWAPNQGRYSPLWDVFPAQWSAAAVAQGLNLRQTDRSPIDNLVSDGLLTGPGGAAFGPAGIVVNCPIISMEG